MQRIELEIVRVIEPGAFEMIKTQAREAREGQRVESALLDRPGIQRLVADGDVAVGGRSGKAGQSARADGDGAARRGVGGRKADTVPAIFGQTGRSSREAARRHTPRIRSPRSRAQLRTVGPYGSVFGEVRRQPPGLMSQIATSRWQLLPPNNFVALQLTELPLILDHGATRTVMVDAGRGVPRHRPSFLSHARVT